MISIIFGSALLSFGNKPLLLALGIGSASKTGLRGGKQERFLVSVKILSIYYYP